MTDTTKPSTTETRNQEVCVPESLQNTGLIAGNMLSVDFSTPLAGPGRAERIRQMSRNHGAFEKSRLVQEILVKIQQVLRRMPGVSSTESNDIITQLQEAGQTISQETSQLVDALMNLTLDQEDTDKAIARMGLEASLAKATIEDQAQSIRDLRGSLDVETKKREQAEFHVSNVMSELHDLTEKSKALKDKAVGGNQSEESDSDSRDEIIKGLEDTIIHLEDQVNNRRSLWVMKHPDPQSVARAMETLADSVQDKQTAAHNTIMSIKSLAGHEAVEDQQDSSSNSNSNSNMLGFRDVAGPAARPPSVFQRSLAMAPPKFGPLQAGPPRAPSAFSHDRRAHAHAHIQAQAQAQAHAHAHAHAQQQQQQSSWTSGQARLAQGQSPLYASASQFSRPPPRKTYHPPSRYRPNAAEFQPAGYTIPEHRPGTAFGHRPASRDHQQQQQQTPQTPTSANRNRYGRFDGPLPSNVEPGSGASSSSAAASTLVGRGSSSHHVVGGPLIHMTDQSVAAWNECIMEFYALIRAFVERHANQPDAAMAMRVSALPLWPVLLATYHPLSAKEATSYLDLHLREDNPKCCLVTRVIIDYIVNRVWVPNAWTGASDYQSTYALIDLEKQLEKTQGQPSAQRQPLLDKQAFIIEQIVKSESPSFHASKVQDMMASLLSTVQPLLNRLHNPSDAYRDLEQVAEHAWELSCKILTSRLTFDFRFPEVGTRFSSQSMLPIWPPLDPTELQAKHWRVALVTTPVITCRNDTGSNISAHSVALADVYCMQ